MSEFYPVPKGIYPPPTAIENLDEIRDQLLRGMPRYFVFLNLSRNEMTKDREFGPRLTHPDSIEILEEAPKRGSESSSTWTKSSGCSVA